MACERRGGRGKKEIVMDKIINLPAMPKPEDFGVKPEDWQHHGEVGQEGSRVWAYLQALEAWKEVGKAIGGQVR